MLPQKAKTKNVKVAYFSVLFNKEKLIA